MSTEPILFSINYSLPALRLLKTGKIELDRFKCPDWPDLVTEVNLRYPVAVHFNLTAGNGTLPTEWEPIDQMLEQTNTPFVNVHLETNPACFQDMAVDTIKKEDRQRILDMMHADLHCYVKRYGPERVIAENVPYQAHAGQVARPAVEPDLIAQAIRETGCGFLFDLGHARICAHYTGMSEEDYIRLLPMEKLREIHVAGVQAVDGVLCDHLAMTREDWDLLDQTLENIKRGEWPRPWMAALEYGGLGPIFAWRNDPDVMEEQAPKIYNALQRLNT
jgi:uncharacterized protein